MPNLFAWRWQLLASNLSSTTKHVLLTLSCHMDDNGDQAFPSIETLAKECSLSKKPTIKHLKLAAENGWITIQNRMLPGQKWRQNFYQICTPDEPKAGVLESQSWCTSSPKVVDLKPKAGVPESQSWCTSGPKVVYQGHTNSTYNSTKNSTTNNSRYKNSGDQGFIQKHSDTSWAEGLA